MVARHVLPVVAAASIAVSLAASVETQIARVHVAVADSRNRPVTNLTAADFAVSIDDQLQEIVSVAPATEPLSVVVLTDRLGLDQAYGPPDVHRGLAAFVKAIRTANADSKFALTTFDGPVVRVSSFATPAAEFDRTIGRLSTVATDGALLDGLTDACKALAEAPSGRRVIFVLFAAYRAETSTATVETVAAMLRRSGASLWALEVESTAGATSFGDANRELVVDRGSGLTGGMRDSVASAVGVESSARRMGELIASQYVITYRPLDSARGGPGGGNGVRKVGVKRTGLKVYAPSWIAGATND
jgi:VWFA-related protein